MNMRTLKFGPQKNLYSIVFFVVYIICLYTNIGLVLGGKYVGGIFTIASALLVVLTFGFRGLNFSGVQKNYSAIFFLWVLFVVFFGAFFSADSISEFYGSSRAGTLLILSVVLTALASIEIRKKFSDGEVFLVFGVLLVVLLVGSGLEIIGYIRGVSDNFREFVFQGGFIYDSSERDTAIFGSERPKFFTQEPSHLAKGIGLAVFLCFSVIPNPVALVFVFILSTLGYFITGSPSVLAGLMVSLLLFAAVRGGSFVGGFFWVVVSGLLVLASANMHLIAGFFPGDRALMVSEGADTSVVERFLVPPRIAFDIILERPFFGIGLGGKDAHIEATINAFGLFPYYEFSRLYYDLDLSFGWYSAFYEGLGCIGLVGIISVYLFVARIIINTLQINAPKLVVLPVFIIVLIVDAGFPSPRTWGYFSLYAVFFLSAYSRFYGNALTPSLVLISNDRSR